MFESLKFNVKLTYKTLLFGYKIHYNGYDKVNNLISQIFYAIYKYWLRNNNTLDIRQWEYGHLKTVSLYLNKLKTNPNC